MDYRERILLGDKWKYALPKRFKILFRKAKLFKVTLKISGQYKELNVHCGNWYIKDCPFKLKVRKSEYCLWHLVSPNSKDVCPLFLILKKGYENWKKIKAWERRVKS